MKKIIFPLMTPNEINFLKYVYQFAADIKFQNNLETQNTPYVDWNGNRNEHGMPVGRGSSWPSTPVGKLSVKADGSATYEQYTTQAQRQYPTLYGLDYKDTMLANKCIYLLMQNENADYDTAVKILDAALQAGGVLEHVYDLLTRGVSFRDMLDAIDTSTKIQTATGVAVSPAQFYDLIHTLQTGTNLSSHTAHDLVTGWAEQGMNYHAIQNKIDAVLARFSIARDAYEDATSYLKASSLVSPNPNVNIQPAIHDVKIKITADMGALLDELHKLGEKTKHDPDDTQAQKSFDDVVDAIRLVAKQTQENTLRMSPYVKSLQEIESDYEFEKQAELNREKITQIMGVSALELGLVEEKEYNRLLTDTEAQDLIQKNKDIFGDY